jgi:hypothetical protein
MGNKKKIRPGRRIKYEITGLIASQDKLIYFLHLKVGLIQLT